MKRFRRGLRLWHGVPAVFVGVAIGWLTNVATGDGANPAVFAGLGAAVLAAAGLAVVQARSDERSNLAGRRRERDLLLGPLLSPHRDVRSAAPSDLLAATNAIAPYEGRTTLQDDLADWCSDDGTIRFRLLSAGGGVGKSRLAVQVATTKLDDAWASGQVLGVGLDRLHDLVVESGQPILAVIDDADLVPCLPLLRQAFAAAPEAPTTVRYLMIVRDATAFLGWLDGRLPGRKVRERVTVEELDRPLPGDSDVHRGDRPRWFVHAVDAYLTALGKPPLRLLAHDVGRVGQASEPMIVTQVRALLTALEGTAEAAARYRLSQTEDLAARLMEHERERWRRSATDPVWNLPERRDPDVFDQAVQLLLLVHHPSESSRTERTRSADGLKQLRRFADLGDNDRDNVVTWFDHLYPFRGAAVPPTTQFLVSAVIAMCIRGEWGLELDGTRLAPLLVDNPFPLARIVRAAVLFPDAKELLVELVETGTVPLVQLVRAVVVAGPAAQPLQSWLAPLITARRLDMDGYHELMSLLAGIGWLLLREAVQEAAVETRRATAVPADDDQDFAELLLEWGRSRFELGRRAAQAPLGEARRRWTAMPDCPARTEGLATATALVGGAISDIDPRPALPLLEEGLALLASVPGDSARALFSRTQLLRWRSLTALGRNQEADEQLRDTRRELESLTDPLPEEKASLVRAMVYQSRTLAYRNLPREALSVASAARERLFELDGCVEPVRMAGCVST